MVRVKGWGGTTEQGNSACTELPIWEGSPALAQPERVRRVPWNKDTEDVHAPPVRVVGRGTNRLVSVCQWQSENRGPINREW